MAEPDWKSIAYALYGLLDDIDTAGDMAKDNDKLYRSLVKRAHEKRHQFAISDGYSLTWQTGLPIASNVSFEGMAYNATPERLSS